MSCSVITNSSNQEVLKVTSTTKLFFALKQLLMYNYRIFYLKQKCCFLLAISRFLCFCEIYRFQSRSVTSSYALLDNGNYTYAYFFLILSTIKMKFGQVLVCCMTNISNMFLVLCQRLETSSRPFYEFIKMTT